MLSLRLDRHKGKLVNIRFGKDETLELTSLSFQYA
jgi:hypothetical protein